MLGYHATLAKQRFFKDKYATVIDKFLVTRDYALTFCKQIAISNKAKTDFGLSINTASSNLSLIVSVLYYSDQSYKILLQKWKFWIQTTDILLGA